MVRIGIKDNICIKNQKVTIPSKILKGFKSLYNSYRCREINQRRCTLFIGTLNCDEFMGNKKMKILFMDQ